MIRNGYLLAIALLLAGCTALRISGMPSEERQVIQLINYAQRVATMTDDEQRGESSASNQAFTTDKDTMSRMRLAILLATPGASVYDATRAVNLLEPMATQGEATSTMHALARLLYVQLNERAREQKRANRMREQIESSKDVESTLRQQLDALKEVEHTIMQREQESLHRRR